MRPGEAFRDLLSSSSRLVIVHHWDSDGIASCSLLADAARDQGATAYGYVPAIGVYGLNALSMEELRRLKPDAVVVVDYALRARDLEALERELGVPVALVDHHVNKLPARDLYYNPVARGARPASYPSTTWVLRELLGLPLSLRVVLGLVGDLGLAVRRRPMWGEVEAYTSRARITLDEVLELSRLVDSCYQVMDREAVARAVDKLSAYRDDLEAALADEEWRSYAKLVRGELSRLVGEARPVEDLGVVKVFEASSRFMLVSALGRELARRHRGSVVVLAFRVLGGPSYVYVRSHRYVLLEALERLKRIGLNAGGKDKVFSVQLPGGDLSGEVLDLVVSTVVDALPRPQ